MGSRNLFRVRKRPLVLLAVTLMAAGAAPPTAAEEPLVTDRPDFTESSSSVGKGVFQLEGGAGFTRLAGGGEITTLGEVLARWGVAETLELRFQLPTYEWDNFGNGNQSGFTGSGIGLKLDFAQGAGRGLIGGMEAALIASTTIPTGTAEFASSKWQPSALIATSWELSPGVGLGANIGAGRPADDDNRYTTFWVSAALGIEVARATSVFFELYGFNREEERGPNTATLQIGTTYLVNTDFQLDLRAARRLTDDGPDLLVGVGLSWRLGG